MIRPATPVEATAYNQAIYVLILLDLAAEGCPIAPQYLRLEYGRMAAPNLNVRVASLHHEINPEHRAFYRKVKHLYVAQTMMKRMHG